MLSERDSEDESPFHKLHRHTSIGRENENDDPPRFAMHRLRTTRPLKKMSQNPNVESGSSGEDDDEDGFEILTAENLFSTLLSRVSAPYVQFHFENLCKTLCLCVFVYRFEL